MACFMLHKNIYVVHSFCKKYIDRDFYIRLKSYELAVGAIRRNPQRGSQDVLKFEFIIRNIPF